VSYDAEITLRQGAVRPVYAQVAALNGTLTLQPGGNFTLYAGSGAVEPGFQGVALSGFDPAPLAAPRVWFVLDTSALPLGVYAGVFTFQGLGSDGAMRTYTPDVQITVAAPVEVEATYDPSLLLTSPLFQTRFHAADTNVANAVWSDAELNYCLNLTGNLPELAAARALRAAAADAAKLAVVTKVGQLGNDETQVHTALLRMASALEAQVAVPSQIESPDQTFSTDSDSGATPGTMTGW